MYQGPPVRGRSKIRNANFDVFNPSTPLVTHRNERTYDPLVLRNAVAIDPPATHTHISKGPKFEGSKLTDFGHFCIIKDKKAHCYSPL